MKLFRIFYILNICLLAAFFAITLQNLLLQKNTWYLPNRTYPARAKYNALFLATSLSNNETVYSFKNVCISNGTIEIVVDSKLCLNETERILHGFAIKCVAKKKEYFFKNDIVFFINAYPVIQNLHHLFKDFLITLYQIFLSARHFEGDQNM